VIMAESVRSGGFRHDHVDKSDSDTIVRAPAGRGTYPCNF